MEETAQNHSNNLESQLEIANSMADYFREAYSDAVKSMLAMDDKDWVLLSGHNEGDEFTLGEIRDVSAKLGEWTDTNPLLGSAHEKRCAYMFGNGYSMGRETEGGKISARIQGYIDDDVNQDALFSEEALATNERSRYTAGFLPMMYKKEKHQWQRLPIAQIADYVTDPDNDEIVWFYQRSYDRTTIDLTTGHADTETVKVWYATDRAPITTKSIRRIKDEPVDRGIIVVDDVVGRHAGATFGVPDCFSAAPWAHAYSKYLKDGSKVLSALAEFAWKLTPKKAAAAANAGAVIKTGAGAGSTAITDMDLQSMPTKDAVDLSTGRPLAAQVAGPLGLSVEVLLSDSGEDMVGSSGGPSIRILETRRRVNAKFLKRCLKVMGVKDPTITWAKMSPDADYREQQTLNAALGSGLFWADEIREPLAKVGNIKLSHPSAPPGFMLPNNSESLPRKDIDQDGSSVKPDGTTSLTNGQGKVANTNKPSYGVNDLRATGGRDPKN